MERLFQPEKCDAALVLDCVTHSGVKGLFLVAQR